MALQLSAALASRIYRHAQEDYPREACGILVGRREGGDRRVSAITPGANVEPTRVHDRFLLDPRTLLRVMRETRGTDTGVIGYYHSHPDHPSRPSQTDYQFASEWADHAFLIVEVRDHLAVECQSWVVSNGAAWFEEEPVEIT